MPVKAFLPRGASRGWCGCCRAFAVVEYATQPRHGVDEAAIERRRQQAGDEVVQVACSGRDFKVFDDAYRLGNGQAIFD